MDITELDISTKNLDHLGVVSGIIDELGIVEKIDSLIPISDLSKLSIGNRVKGMILSGLGFTNYRLYMSEHFFKNKPVSRLFDDTVEAEHFNDDALGRCLDKIHEYGSSAFYAQIAFAVAKEKGLLENGYRHDSTSLSVSGDYEECDEDSINITHGYSKDHRFDLKQITLMLTMSLSNSFPLWISALDGNANDKKSFHEVDKKFRAFRKQLKQSSDPLIVGDSALYSSELLKRSTEDIDLYWLTRVPESIADAKKLVMADEADINWISLNDDYKVTNHSIERQSVKQRWQLVFSEKAYVKECKTFHKRLPKLKEKCEAELKKLKIFACETDAH
ncbi:MAG TPA: IS1634 family transposase [Victivallales bacterium]|nr:IS1634 family transposase [Victivallales bacterium]